MGKQGVGGLGGRELIGFVSQESLKGREDGTLVVDAKDDRLGCRFERALSGSEDETLKLWDVETLMELDSIGFDGAPTSLAVHGDRVLVGNKNTTVTVYRIR